MLILVRSEAAKATTLLSTLKCKGLQAVAFLIKVPAGLSFAEPHSQNAEEIHFQYNLYGQKDALGPSFLKRLLQAIAVLHVLGGL